MKPEREPFFRFYFIRPFIEIGRVRKDFGRAWLSLFGWWTCDICRKFYSPRVKQYERHIGPYCSICDKKLEEIRSEQIKVPKVPNIKIPNIFR